MPTIILFFLFTVLPALELVLIIKVGARIGALNTLALLILIGAGGAALARIQGFWVVNKIQENLNRGLMPSEELIDGFLILIGGILLLTPGFITDIWGVFLLIPWTRSLIKFILRRKMAQMVKDGQVVTFTHFGGTSKRRFDDIDVSP